MLSETGIFSPGLTIVPVVPWKVHGRSPPRHWGGAINCQIFYHAILTFERLKRSDDWKRWSTFWEKKSAPLRKSWKILATRMRKGPRLTLIWGSRMVNPALGIFNPRIIETNWTETVQDIVAEKRFRFAGHVLRNDTCRTPSSQCTRLDTSRWQEKTRQTKPRNVM